MRALLIFVAGCWTGTATEPRAGSMPDQPMPPIAARGQLAHQSAEALITVEQLRAVTGFGDPLETRHGDPTTASYDDLHFQAAGKGERFDFMVRVWTLAPTAASSKLDDLTAELPGVKPLPGLADRAITAVEGEIYGVAFYDKRGATVLVTCGMGQCRSLDQTITLARGVASRLH